MQAILTLPPNLPVHDAAPSHPVPSRIVAEWPVGTFIENLAVLPDQSIAVSVLSEARLDRVSPQGKMQTWRQFNAPPTGSAMSSGHLFVAVGEPGGAPPVLWRLDPASGEGSPWMTLDGVQFANGLTPFAPGQLLLAESWLGRLLRIDLASRTVSVWLEDERLTRSPGIDFLPGANGVKRFGNEVTVSSNSRALMLRAAVAGDNSAGPLEQLATRVRVDDFAYDQTGSLYLCTHIGHSLDRLDPDGTRITLAGVAEGLAGSTACAFHPDGGLYVTTTGGILAPPNGRLEPARLVRLDVGAQGHSLDHAWERNA
ncbi:hypothetical protein WDZ92_12400 [Nostoc sp. NIES-2111]